MQLARSSCVGLRDFKPESVTPTPAEVAEDIVTRAQNALFQMHRALDLAAVERAVALISSAQMVHTFGSGANSAMILTGCRTGSSGWGCVSRPRMTMAYI